MPDLRRDTTAPRVEPDTALLASLPWHVERIERPEASASAPSTSGKPPWLQAMPETVAPAVEDLVQREPGEIEDDPELAEDCRIDPTIQTAQEPAAEVNTVPPAVSSEAPRARYVPTAAIDQAVKGCEAEVVRGVGIAWHGRDHIHCPYGTHPDRNPSWRLTEQGLAICTCRTAHNVFHVVMAMEGLDFDAAKIRVAEILGRQDLIVTPGESSGCTLAQLAEAKKLPAEFLREHGFFDLAKNGKYHNKAAVGISYKNRDGENKWLRIRTELSGNSKRKFRWRKGDVGAPLFGAHNMAEHLPKPDYLVVDEGETDTLTFWYHGIAALGLPGAGTWSEERYAALLDGVETIYIIVEPDSGGAATLRWVARSSIASRVRLVHMPAETKDPSALYLADPENFETAFRALLDAAEPFESEKHAPEKAASMADGAVSYKDFFAYLPQHNYIFVPTRAHWPASSVNSCLPGIPSPDGEGEIPASVILDKTRSVEQMTWVPGLPMIIRDRLVLDGGWIDRKGVSCFNLYLPPATVPGDPRGAERWIKHVHYVYPNDADHIIKWLAHRVQKPGEKINHILLLGGPPGIGKDTILEPVKYAIGPWNFQETGAAQVGGRFNGFLKAVILRISEARDLGDFDRFQFYEHMKIYAASPPDVLRVDEKNIHEYRIINAVGIIITTNHKTDGIFLPADDRRHYVAWSDLVKEDPKFAGDYWKGMYAYFADGGARDVTAYLLQLDISGFDPKAPPPLTEAFWAIADANRPAEEGELADILDRISPLDQQLNPIRPNAITLRRLAGAADDSNRGFADWLNDRKNRRAIPHRLGMCGYVPVRNPYAKDGMWKVNNRREAIYAKSSLSLRDQIAAAVAITK
jgi:hypothetical protein